MPQIVCVKRKHAHTIVCVINIIILIIEKLRLYFILKKQNTRNVFYVIFVIILIVGDNKKNFFWSYVYL